MAQQIKGAPPPTGAIGYAMVNGQRVEVFPTEVWFRFWAQQKDAAEVLVAGSVTGSVLSESVSPPTVGTVSEAYTGVSANNPSPDNEANRTPVVQLLVSPFPYRVSVDVWATGTFNASGTGAATVDAFANAMVSGETFSPSLYGASASLALVGPGFSASTAFTTQTLSEVLEIGTPGRAYKLIAKKSAPGTELVSITGCTLYVRITRLS